MAPSSTPTPLTWLRYFRVRGGYSMDALSEQAGVGKVQLSKYENRRRTPRAATAERIAKVFGVPADIVFPPPGSKTPDEVLNDWVILRMGGKVPAESPEAARKRRYYEKQNPATYELMETVGEDGQTFREVPPKWFSDAMWEAGNR